LLDYFFVRIVVGIYLFLEDCLPIDPKYDNALIYTISDSGVLCRQARVGGLLDE
jgi:hypothetical protein